MDSGLFCARCDEIVCMACGAKKMSGGGGVPCGICGGPARTVDEGHHPTWFPGERPTGQSSVTRGQTMIVPGQVEGGFERDLPSADAGSMNDDYRKVRRACDVSRDAAFIAVTAPLMTLEA